VRHSREFGNPDFMVWMLVFASMMRLT